MLADNGDPYSPRSNSDSASPALAGKLASAETELAQLRAVEATVTEPKAEVSKLLADLPKVALRAVDQLEKTLASGDVARARTEIREHVGVVEVEADAQEIRVYSKQALHCYALSALIQVSMVAGARFGTYLHGCQGG
jgi:hypothetical protein